MTDARTIAALARASTTSLDEAADLIQSFANVAAHAASAKAIEEQHARTIAILDASIESPCGAKIGASA